MQRNKVAGKQWLLAGIVITIIILGALLIDPIMTMAAKEYTVSGQTSQKIYDGASENGKVVANAVPGNTFTILETVKDSQGRNWHHVSLAGGTTGYIIASRVVEVEEESASEPVTEPEEVAEEASDDSAEEMQEQDQNQEENETDQVETESTEEPSENAEDEGKSENEDLTNMFIMILSNTNLRDEPSLDGGVLIVIPKGIKTQPDEKINRDGYFWYRLTYLGQTGYVRADTVKESIEAPEEETVEDSEDEITETVSESTTNTTTPKVVQNAGATTVSYEESYARRHKWDDPEMTTTEEMTTHKRFIDIYAFLFVIFAVLLAVIGVLLLNNVTHELKRNSRINRKRRRQRGESR
ncbi:MAG: SH3 domain-containing protein [Butyrivibrio sp.]|uniref:SH3 domain-containing protein n=1 Tax=Butyrivibrio sp. TaxID=28121 RepID=UPI001B26D3AC|nr:SH3 domain-containing protein [Butyrivibrio sp.]MBO6242184.1 SH3 domain-containing protein [Butyrivibrio sp.]